MNPVDAKYVIGDKLPERYLQWCAARVSGQTPGFDFSGTVVDAPPGSDLHEGEEVFGLGADPTRVAYGQMGGSFAEFVAAPRDQIARKPPELSHPEAAALPLVGTTCLQLMQSHGLGPGQRLLLIGASGGVGSIGTQVASRLGAEVTAVCSARNESFVRECGASSVVDYRSDVLEALRQEVAARGPFDLVMDCVHSVAETDKAAGYRERIEGAEPALVRRDGPYAHHYVVLGGATGNWARAGLKRVLGWNLFPRGFELFWITMPGARKELEFLSSLVSAGLRPRVATLLPLREAGLREAFERLRSRRTTGKVVLDVSAAATG